MSLDEGILESVAKDGTMDYEKWPGLLDPLLERLEHIVHHEFPLPRVPQNSYETVSTVPLASQLSSQTNSNKENAPPSQFQSPARHPPVPLFSSPASSERVPNSQPPSGPADDALPPPLFALLSSIKATLKNCFSTRPPHTIQRLAELILRPTAHYRTLPSYLRALDRVVSVSSSADIFPLPHATPFPGSTIDSAGVDGVNGVGTTNFMFTDSSLGSDESLGGALLTPIPWLSNQSTSDEDVDAPADADGGSAASTVQDSGLISQEGDTRGIQETSQSPQSQQQQSLNSGSGTLSTNTEASEEIPHARGPPVLGVEDLGLQNGEGVEMTLDTKPGNAASAPTEHNTQRDQDAPAALHADADGDVSIADAPEKKANQHSDQKKDEPGRPTSGD
ncbi:hypothetical protein VTO42DRAFT_5037 [Malbranchea cinnamomea]